MTWFDSVLVRRYSIATKCCVALRRLLRALRRNDDMPPVCRGIAPVHQSGGYITDHSLHGRTPPCCPVPPLGRLRQIPGRSGNRQLCR